MPSKDKTIRISRKAIITSFIEKLYGQDNVNKICDGDDMLIPVSRLEDWCHDMGIILGLAIKDALDS